MKTISVKEAANYLGITPRAITYRLEKGHLKGNLTKNEFGSPEWRIYPNKEIVEAMNKQLNADYLNESKVASDQEAVDTVEVESVSEHREEDSEDGKEVGGWRDTERDGLRFLAEELVRPIIEKVENQAAIIRDKDQEIEHHKRQLRLLPDMEKQAEKDRKIAEEKSLESIALQKQIAAMKAEQKQLELKIENVELDLVPSLQKELEEKREEKIREVTILEEKIRNIDSELNRAKDFENQVNELKAELDSKKEKEEIAKKQIEKLGNEKKSIEEETQAKISELEAQLSKYKSPWWKKWFLPTDQSE